MLTVKQVAERLNCSIATVYALIDGGTLACVKIGAKGSGVRVTPDDLEAFIDVRRTGPQAVVRRSRPLLKHIRL